jgi:hypothetical protein
MNYFSKALKTTPLDRYYCCPQFTKEETKGQRKVNKIILA